MTLARKTPLKSRKPMRSGRSTGNPTKAQSARWDAMRSIGCIACRQNLGLWGACPMPIEIHHLLSGGRRIGHDATLALCHWHHQAKRFPSTTSGYAEQAKLYGPSLEREPRRFAEMYGTDEELLALQNDLMARKGVA